MCQQEKRDMHKPGNSRRDFLKIMGMGAAAMILPHWLHGCGKIRKRPNFIVVLCDDLGYGDPGCYGHPHIRTPNIDRFAGEGMKFTDCYAGAPVCSPARAAMLTGRTPHRCGIYDYIPGHGYHGRGPIYKDMHLKTEEISVATLLKNTGYATCHLGKWHLNVQFDSFGSPTPADHGFDYWFSTMSNARPSHQNPDNFVRNGTPVGKLEGYAAELIADEGIDWLLNKWDMNRPFCMFVWFHEPHEPIATDERFMKMYEGHKEAIYYGNVTQIDHAFGRLMKTVDELNLRDETFVMFTSDNGPETLNRYKGAHRSFGTPGPLRGMKLHMYEGGIRVPGIIRWTGHIQPGSVSHEPINGTDVLPTLCALAGVKEPGDRPIDGVSIVPLFTGGKVERKAPLYWQYDIALSSPFTVAMRRGDWKILADTDLTKFELYNLRNDIGENHNLAESEPEHLEAMKKTLMKLHAEIDAEAPVWPEK